MKRYILSGIVLVMLAIGFIWVASIGLNKSEEHECLMLLQQSKEYHEKWYSTSWQRDMCQHYGIELPLGAITN